MKCRGYLGSSCQLEVLPPPHFHQTISEVCYIRWIPSSELPLQKVPPGCMWKIQFWKWHLGSNCPGLILGRFSSHSRCHRAFHWVSFGPFLRLQSCMREEKRVKHKIQITTQRVLSTAHWTLITLPWGWPLGLCG